MNKKPTQKFWNETSFSRKWGILAITLAEQDNVTVDAIHMRVLNWGNPFQRKHKPSKWEKLYCKSLCELAQDMGMHPMSIAQRHDRLGSIYAIPLNKNKQPNTSWHGDTRWRDLTWLHPLHPDYTAWREGTLFAESIKKPAEYCLIR